MTGASALTKAYENSPILPLDANSRYILFSDCHRGIGNAGDNFLKNENIYLAALQHYYKEGYTYLELGDGDELWENRSLDEIMAVHGNVFRLLTRFYQEDRLYMLYGNHDIVKSWDTFSPRHCASRYCHIQGSPVSQFPGIRFYPGLRLADSQNEYELFLTHGHQVDPLNSTFWPLARFLVRYLWKPLELVGVLNPTSAALNNKRRSKTERRLTSWIEEQNRTNSQNLWLIAGHTHRPTLPNPGEPAYGNTGCCVHPHYITGIEIQGYRLILVKWAVCVRDDGTLGICREELNSIEFNTTI